MNICFEVIAFNADAFLEPVLESILPFGPVVAVEGPVRYYRERGYTTSTDRTNEILADLLPAARVVHGQFEEKDDLVNAAVPLIPPDTQFVWHVDADECWEAETIRAVLNRLDEFDSVAFKPLTFFGGFESVLTGFETRAEWRRITRWHVGARWQTHRPPTVLAPDGRPYRQRRHWDAPFCFFHYSYVMPAAVKSKVEYYASWGQGVIPEYMERVWLPWVLGDDERKEEIEIEFNGVHEWMPARRGDCRTTPYRGRHPAAIEKRLPDLNLRFMHELAEIAMAGRYT